MISGRSLWHVGHVTRGRWTLWRCVGPCGGLSSSEADADDADEVGLPDRAESDLDADDAADAGESGKEPECGAPRPWGAGAVCDERRLRRRPRGPGSSGGGAVPADAAADAAAAPCQGQGEEREAAWEAAPCVSPSSSDVDSAEEKKGTRIAGVAGEGAPGTQRPPAADRQEW